MQSFFLQSLQKKNIQKTFQSNFDLYLFIDKVHYALYFFTTLKFISLGKSSPFILVKIKAPSKKALFTTYGLSQFDTYLLRSSHYIGKIFFNIVAHGQMVSRVKKLSPSCLVQGHQETRVCCSYQKFQGKRLVVVRKDINTPGASYMR